MRIYLDNAATTALDPEVFEAMKPFMLEDFGNPSSTHAHGRKVRAAIESSRKKIAELLNCTPGEIIFTSGGTEADNALIVSGAYTYGIKHAISTPIEHHAVTHTLETLAKRGALQLHYVQLNEKGHVDMTNLEALLKQYPNALISLMHANNEIGNLLDIKRVGEMAKEYKAFFHSDTVQTMGHYAHDMRTLNVSGMTAAAHKFHGPKGVGMLYINENVKIKPFVHGGSQERNMRAGTENLYGIIGFAKALELATTHYENDSQYITDLKMYMMEQLQKQIAGVSFNGDPTGKSLYAVLSVSFPKTEKSEMILFNLDINNICASGGSACTSGADQGSHVIRAINNNPNQVTVRFSFSKHNTKAEIDQVIAKLKELI